MITIPQRLLGEALLISAKKNASKTAIIYKDKEYTYKEMLDAAMSLATLLVKDGLRKGDRVAIYMNNSWESVVSIYAVLLAGGIFLMINPQTKANKLRFILKDSGAVAMVAESKLKREINEGIKGLRGLMLLVLSGENFIVRNRSILVEDFDVAAKKDIDSTCLHKVIANDLAALIYTSGSTGFPKGVMLSHQNMVFTSWSLIEYLRLQEYDRIMLVIPLSFDYGLYQLLMSVTIGGTLIVEQSFSFPSTIYKKIEKYSPTVFPGVPTIYAMMLSAHKKSGLQFDCINKITNTAAALPYEYVPGLKRLFPNALIFMMYGLTECKRVSYLEPELVDVKPGSVGKAIPGTEVFLIAEDGKPVLNGEPGILHVRGPHVMLGYWNNKKLSAEMLRSGNLPYERVLCTNDWFRKDKEGYLYFLGRNDDIIKTRGEKVSPVEVENVILAVKAVREVVVFGIPNELLGEEVVAVVTCDGDEQHVKENALQECAKHLESFMIPSRLIVIDEMPKSLNGKIDKKELKERFLIDLCV